MKTHGFMIKWILWNYFVYAFFFLVPSATVSISNVNVNGFDYHINIENVSDEGDVYWLVLPSAMNPPLVQSIRFAIGAGFAQCGNSTHQNKIVSGTQFCSLDVNADYKFYVTEFIFYHFKY